MWFVLDQNCEGHVDNVKKFSVLDEPNLYQIFSGPC